jgi:hypothetical protein
MDLEKVRLKLLKGERQPCQIFRRPPHPGVYALFALHGRDDAFTDLGLISSEHRLLYIGVAIRSLATRYHPARASSRKSSPRRSFGALLFDKLELEVLPRIAGTRAHWQFRPQNEAELSRWMREHLAYAFVSLTREDAKKAECKLIVS